MFAQKICWIFLMAVTLVTECHSYKTIYRQPISKGKVNGDGVMMKYCEYKLLKLRPESKVLDPDGCLSCKCNKRYLTCKDAKYIPGCKRMPGGKMTQNPYDKKWKIMVDGLIKSKYVGKYQILQVRTQVVAGSNNYMQLFVQNRLLCYLTIYEDLRFGVEITKDTCGLKQ